jgi:hypothetical protein
MQAFCHGFARVFKSPLRVQVWFLLRSRQTQRTKLEQCKQQRDEFVRQTREQAKEIERLKREAETLQAELDAEREKVRQLQTEAQDSSNFTFYDPPVGQHGFGAKMITLVLRLIKEAKIKLRAVPRVLKVIFSWLGINMKIPHWTTGRLWFQRLGHAELTQPTEKVSDMILIMDHSVQIGQEKVLAVLGVRQSELPPRGQALRLEDVRPIATIPQTSTTKEDVHQALQEIAQEHGVPRAIVTDHGSELVGGIELFQQEHKEDSQSIVDLYDFKHKAACQLKALLEKDERFIAFQSEVGKTRRAIQQTELGFLVPPGPKPKSRFMNLGPMLQWAEKTLQVIERPSPKVQQWVTRNRLDEKLGWLRDYRDDLAKWLECQRVVDLGVGFANKHGVFRGAHKELRKDLPKKFQHAESRILANTLVSFVRCEAKKLKEGERFPLSSEIIESSFGQYKNLEDQHSKGGFTSLILCFSALFIKVTPQVVQQAFSRSTVKDVRQWISDKMGVTLGAKRRIAYHEAKASIGATKMPRAA